MKALRVIEASELAERDRIGWWRCVVGDACLRVGEWVGECAGGGWVVGGGRTNWSSSGGSGIVSGGSGIVSGGGDGAACRMVGCGQRTSAKRTSAR